jgi:hypothetical protein
VRRFDLLLVHVRGPGVLLFGVADVVGAPFVGAMIVVMLVRSRHGMDVPVLVAVQISMVAGGASGRRMSTRSCTISG